MDNRPFVSVVVPAYNAQRTIKLTIEALLSQSYDGPQEIIVVDDGSCDDTHKIIQSFPDVVCVRQENQGPAAARNRGFAASRGAFIFFTDSDCIPEAQWIEKCLKGFSFDDIAVVCGSYGIANKEFLLSRCIHDEIVYRHRYHMPDHPKSFGSYNFCVRRNVFSMVGGFNTSYRNASGEDNDLSYKILSAGFRIFFARHALVRHFFPTLILKYLKEQFSHGFWRVRMYRDHPHMALGDDYTFWKDIVEPPLVLIFAFAFGGGVWVPFFDTLAFFIIMVLSIMELAFSFRMIKAPCHAVFYAFVMLLRAFSRTIGFMTGTLSFFLPKSPKKIH